MDSHQAGNSGKPFTRQSAPRRAHRRPVLTPEEREAARERERILQVERGIATAAFAQELLAAGVPGVDHDYLTRKGVGKAPPRTVVIPHEISRVHRDERGRALWEEIVPAGSLIVPLSEDGTDQTPITSAQFIQPDGFRKYLAYGGTGCFLLEGLVGTRLLAAGEGLATCMSWWRAHPEWSVMVCFGWSGLGKHAPRLGAQLLLSDNDEPKQGKQHGVGEIACIKTGLPYVIPPCVDMDWNDAIQRFGTKILDFTRFGETVDLRTLPWVELPSIEYDDLWRQGSTITDPVEAAGWCRSALFKSRSRIPVRMGVDEVVDRLVASVHPGAMSLATLRALVSWFVDYEAQEVERLMKAHVVSDRVLARHDVIEVEQLRPFTSAEIAGYNRFFAVAPPGEGKTQRIAGPMCAEHKDDGYCALLHRTALVHEIAPRIGAEHKDSVDWTSEEFRTVKPPFVCTPVALAIAEVHWIMHQHGLVFLDEADQVLRFAGAGDLVDSGQHGRFMSILTRAEKTLLADAGMSDFAVEEMERLHPGERFLFQIMQPEHSRHARMRVEMGMGAVTRDFALQRLENALLEGGNCWVSCEEKNAARAIDRYLAELEEREGIVLPRLLIHSDTKGSRAVRAFLAAADSESKNYRAVIHTGVISSGISIEHRDGAHFTHGFGFFSGSSCTPGDAFQSMHRVRYLKDWTVALDYASVPDPAPLSNRTAALASIAQGEGVAGVLTDFDRTVERLRHQRDQQRARFGVVLWNLLERNLATVTRFGDLEATDTGWGRIRAKIRAEDRAAVLSAPDIDLEEYKALRARHSRPYEDQVKLIRFYVRQCLAVWDRDVTDADLDVYDGGRGNGRVERLIAAFHGRARASVIKEHLTESRFSESVVDAYQRLFDGIDLRGRISEEQAAAIRGRVVRDREVLIRLGVVGRDWANPRRIPGPAAVLRAIMKRMGLELVTMDVRGSGGAQKHSRKTPDFFSSVKGNGSFPGKCDSARYVVSQTSLAFMSDWGSRRLGEMIDVGTSRVARSDARWSRILDSAPSCFLLTASSVSEILADGSSESAVRSWLSRTQFPEASGWQTFQFRRARGGKPVTVVTRIGIDAAIAALNLAGSVVEGSINGVEQVAPAETVRIVLPDLVFVESGPMPDIPGYRAVIYSIEDVLPLGRVMTRLDDIGEIWNMVAAHHDQEPTELDFALDWIEEFTPVHVAVRPEPDEAVPEFDFESGVLLGWQVPHDHDEATMPECPAEPDWVLAYWDSTEFSESFEREAAMVDEEPA